MGAALGCAAMGYFVGCINPSYIFAKLRGFDIRKRGSANAGASNAFITMGKFIGIISALFDILKAFFVTKLCAHIFENFTLAFSLSAVFCILGHIFPVYMKFSGGKGLACLGGIILSYDWRVFLIMLAAEIIVVLVTDYICFVPITASAAFPVIYGIRTGDTWGTLLFSAAAVVIILKHIENLVRIKKKTEMKFSYLWHRDEEVERMSQSGAYAPDGSEAAKTDVDEKSLDDNKTNEDSDRGESGGDGISAKDKEKV